VAVAGATVSSDGALALTSTVKALDVEPEAAVMVAVPVETAVITPELLTVAIEVLELVHVAVLVMSLLEPPTVTAEAVIWLVSLVFRISALAESVM
jgi:hypothetical protein